MSWVIGTVTLPRGPDRIMNEGPAKIDLLDISSELPIVIAEGFELENFTLEGLLHQTGYSLVQLEGSYLIPLRGYRGSTVVVSTPLTALNGTWLCVDVPFDVSAGGGDPRIQYSIRFVKGSSFEIL